MTTVRVAMLGAGFIGLEVAENLFLRGVITMGILDMYYGLAGVGDFDRFLNISEFLRECKRGCAQTLKR